MLFLVLLSIPCLGAPNQFVILSDLHPAKDCVDQLERVTKEVVALKPAFVVVLGDVGNDEFPGSSVWHMQVIDDAFRKMRQAGIEIHIAPGNHDFPEKAGVADLKRCWFCSQIAPYPMNGSLDAEKDPKEYKRICLEKQYWYSFNWRGLHFVIADSADDVKNPTTGRSDISPAQREWLTNDLCRHANNPSKYPTLVFLHHPEWMSGDRNCVSRPLYNILSQSPTEHTVKAVFGGHYHYGQHWPAKDNLGADVYATPATVITGAYAEYIIGTVRGKSLTFEKKRVAIGKKGEDRNKVEYISIAGEFGK